MRVAVASFGGKSSQVSSASKRKHQLVAVLDNMRSIYNVGSMFRTADGAGIAHLYLCGTTPTPEHPRLAKTALGAENTVSWSYHRNALDLVKLLKAEGHTLVALEGGDTAQGLFSGGGDTPRSPLAFVVGNEVTGVDPGVLSECDTVFSIPMLGQKESLNVTVAFGVAAYCLLPFS